MPLPSAARLIVLEPVGQSGHVHRPPLPRAVLHQAPATSQGVVESTQPPYEYGFKPLVPTSGDGRILVYPPPPPSAAATDELAYVQDVHHSHYVPYPCQQTTHKQCDVTPSAVADLCLQQPQATVGCYNVHQQPQCTYEVDQQPVHYTVLPSSLTSIQTSHQGCGQQEIQRPSTAVHTVQLSAVQRVQPSPVQQPAYAQAIHPYNPCPGQTMTVVHSQKHGSLVQQPQPSCLNTAQPPAVHHLQDCTIVNFQQTHVAANNITDKNLNVPGQSTATAASPGTLQSNPEHGCSQRSNLYAGAPAWTPTVHSSHVISCTTEMNGLEIS